MNPVTVTASKFEEAVQNTPAFLTILTKEEIKNAGVATVNEAIMKLGGVAGRASQQGGSEYTLDIMGFGDAALMNTVIVIDGIPQREADQSEIAAPAPVLSFCTAEIRKLVLFAALLL